MYGYIYETYDTVKNKYYIGKHKGKYDKKYYGSGILISRVINKRKETLTNKAICFCETLEELNEAEKYYIKLYGSRIPNGYNISLGGDGGGHFQKHSEETKRKLSEIHKGKRSWMKGKHFTEEQRKLISERVKEAYANGKGQNIDRKSYWTIEKRKEKSEQMKGKIPWNKGKHGIYSKETLNKIRTTAKNQICSEETRKKMSEQRKGKKHSEETKEKIRQAHLGKPLSEERKKHISEAIKKIPKIKNPKIFDELVNDKEIIAFFKAGPKNYHSGWKELLQRKINNKINHNSTGLPKSEFIKYYKEHNII